MVSVSSKHCNVWRPLPCSSLAVCGGNSCRPLLPTSRFPHFLHSCSVFCAHLICLPFRSSGLHQLIWTRAGASCSLLLEAQSGRKWHVNSWDLPAVCRAWLCPHVTACRSGALPHAAGSMDGERFCGVFSKSQAMLLLCVSIHKQAVSSFQVFHF